MNPLEFLEFLRVLSYYDDKMINMSIKAPLHYLRGRRNQSYAQKPTLHEKFSSSRDINPQTNSTLFSRVPGEVRHLIYQYSLEESPDLSRPYSKHTWHYRPGYTHARFINISLLMTCRRLYLEVDHLAISLNEHLIYNPIKHGPVGHVPYLLNSPKYPSLLKLSQREHIQQVHIFGSQMWLEDWNGQFNAYCKSWLHANHGLGPNHDEHPERLKITIRHTGWWYFLLGENSPLAIDPKLHGRALPGTRMPEDAPFMEGSWGTRFKLLKGLKLFELELETLQENKKDLDGIMERAFKWKLPLGDANILVCDPEVTLCTSWTGSRYFEGLPSTNAAQGKLTPENPQLDDFSASSTSNPLDPESLPPSIRRPSIANRTKNKLTKKGSGMMGMKAEKAQSEEEEELAPEDRLEYYVVTLTFRAQPDKGKKQDEVGENGGKSTEEGLPDETATTEGGVNYDFFSTPRQYVPNRSGFPTSYG